MGTLETAADMATDSPGASLRSDSTPTASASASTEASVARAAAALERNAPSRSEEEEEEEGTPAPAAAGPDKAEVASPAAHCVILSDASACLPPSCAARSCEDDEEPEEEEDAPSCPSSYPFLPSPKPVERRFCGGMQAIPLVCYSRADIQRKMTGLQRGSG